MKKKSAFLVFILMLTLVLSGCGLSKKGSKEDGGKEEIANALPDPAVAIVNGLVISESTLKERMFQVKKNLEDVYGQDMETEDNKMWLEAIKVDLLDDIIWETLLLQEANSQGIQIEDEAIDEYYEDLKSRYPSEESFAEFLDDMSFTVESFKGLIRDQLMMDELLENINMDLEVSAEEIQEHFDLYSEMYDMPEQVAALHLLFPTEEEALEALKEIEGGTAFEYYMEYGDDLGYFQRGMMVQEFEEAAFAAEIGELVGPVESMFGFHLITVYDKLESRIAQLADVENEIRNRLLDGKKNVAFDEYLDSIYLKSTIEKLIEPVAPPTPN